MKNTSKLLVAATVAVALGCLTQKASANAIIGGISFNDGTYTTDLGGGNLGSMGSPASAITLVTGAVVAPGATGSYASPAIAAFTPVTFNTPITFNPPTPDLPLWTLVSGLDTYQFSATQMNAALYTYGIGNVIDEINLSGSGSVEEYVTATPSDVLGKGDGTWTIQLENNAASLSFQSGTATVPDGGATLMLLGGAFCGLGALRRKISSK
jgi:hypothetical protein